MILSILFTLAFSPSHGLDERFSQWRKISVPAPGPARVIGAYSAGCLQGAERLTLDGPGFSFMRTSRNRYYAHPDMRIYLESLVASLRKQKLPVLLIGDVSPPRGGPMISGHASHQSGLDADIWLTMLSKRPTANEKERLSATSYVRNRKALKKNWGQTQVKLVSTAAEFSNVSRIFVSPPIKKYFCEHFPKAPWLYRIRPWWGHDAHMHIRLHCPADSPSCEPQTALDPNDPGCGQDLDWWFSTEADEEWKKIAADKSDRSFPTLPTECEALTQ